MNRRQAKLAQAIKEVVSMAILSELRDPRIGQVTVTDVEVAADTRSAKIYVSVMGEEKDAALSLHGLTAARGYLQRKVADRIQTRNTPILTFKIDRGIKASFEVSRRLQEEAVQNDTETAEDSPTPTEAECQPPN